MLRQHYGTFILLKEAKNEDGCISYQDKATELEDLREFAAHAVLEVLGFHLRHLATGKVKHLLTMRGEGR